MRITVFTPTYNRGYLIKRLYRSLQKQSFSDFEWIVVDDGSTDGTEKQFEQYIVESNPFHIQYIKVENGGKHRAINHGVKMANGELFYIVDSDDYLPSDALEIIDEVEKTIPDNEKRTFGGVCGIKGFNNNQGIGSTFEGDYLDISSLERTKYGISGDKAEVFYTDVLKKYPFPEFSGENFMTECVVWDKIAFDGYKLRFFNRTVMICEYLDDGLSAKGSALLFKNYKGYGLYLAQSIQYKKMTGLGKWNALLDYYGALRDKISFFEIAACLYMNPVVLWLRLLGLRMFYKLYGRW